MIQLVGVLNVTPDSFSDGGQFYTPEKAVQQATALFNSGASIVDIGAESTRPHATPLTADVEWQRLEPVLRQLIPRYPGRISLDSYRPETFERAFAIGPVIVNDVTGMNNPDMVAFAARTKPTVIISHLPGLDVQAAHRLKPVTSAEVVRDDLLIRAAELERKGLKKSQIILDPGLGFGKTPAINWELLKFASMVPQYPVMIGYSRKKFLGENHLELEPNLAAGRIATAAGAAYLRVHDVAGHQILLV